MVVILHVNGDKNVMQTDQYGTCTNHHEKIPQIFTSDEGQKG